MINIGIKKIEYYLPINQLSNEELGKMHPEWDVDKVGVKSGVHNRHIADEKETAFDMACIAIDKLFESDFKIDEIDGIMFCTQSPDYIMPSNAFLVHKKFNFKSRVWAFDYNLACSGFVYGLAIAKGMIQGGMAKNILLITADTYSKYINSNDRSTKMLFGDGAAATIVSSMKQSQIIDVDLASAGSEYESFYIPSGGCRLPKNANTSEIEIDHSGNQKSLEDIQMNGFAVWKFISKTVPIQIKQILEKNNITIDDIDFFAFHQASKLTLDSLKKSLNVDDNKVYSNLSRIGNTVSASIPILLKDAMNEGKLKRGELVLLSGFGVGLSWGTVLIKF